MAITTTVGSVAPTTLVVSTASNVALTQNATTDLLQTGAVTISGAGHTVLFLARTQTNNATLDNQCQVNLLVDGTTVLTDIAGDQIIYKQVLATGSHTVDFNAFSFVSGLTILAAGLTVIDLGL